MKSTYTNIFNMDKNRVYEFITEGVMITHEDSTGLKVYS